MTTNTHRRQTENLSNVCILFAGQLNTAYIYIHMYPCRFLHYNRIAVLLVDSLPQFSLKNVGVNYFIHHFEIYCNLRWFGFSYNRANEIKAHHGSIRLLGLFIGVQLYFDRC